MGEARPSRKLVRHKQLMSAGKTSSQACFFFHRRFPLPASATVAVAVAGGRVPAAGHVPLASAGLHVITLVKLKAVRGRGAPARGISISHFIDKGGGSAAPWTDLLDEHRARAWLRLVELAPHVAVTAWSTLTPSSRVNYSNSAMMMPLGVNKEVVYCFFFK